MPNITNQWWISAWVADNARMTIDKDYISGINNITLYTGWEYGTWLDGIWRGSYWSTGTWINGYWYGGEILGKLIFGWTKSPVSPKSHYRPKLTLSLNYAKYF